MTILTNPRQPRPPKASTTRLLRAVAIGLLAAFAAVAFAIQAGDTKGFDTTIVNAFRDPGDPSRTIGPRWLAEAVRDVTSLGSYSVLTILVLLAVAYLLVARRRFEAIYLAAAVVVGTGLALSSRSRLIGRGRASPIRRTCSAPAFRADTRPCQR